jgi:SAM-dependent methyltransferase
MSAAGAQMLVCQVCSAAGEFRTYEAREMMYGTRDRFEYFECGECGCLQIKEAPRDLGKYYPPDYYSFREAEAPPPAARLKERVAGNLISSYRLTGRGFVGRWLERRHPYAPDLPYWLKNKGLGLRLGSKILDVGCGRGHLLLELCKLGFTDLTGADPYVGAEISYGRGLKILKASLEELDGSFDLIMLHHSFEHMARPREVMGELHRLLKRGRYALVRLPLAGSYAWREYGVDWVQLDAPRHLFLHTPRSLGMLAAAAGFRVAEVVYDSTGFQFAGSEQYRRDMPLFDPASFAVSPPGALFSEERLQEFEARAAELNRAGEGDQACFYLYKP